MTPETADTIKIVAALAFFAFFIWRVTQ